MALARERTIPTERPPLVGEVNANILRIEGCRVVSAADLYGRILGFLDREQETLNTTGIDDVGVSMSHKLMVLNVQSQL
jgi:hypothetical protein